MCGVGTHTECVDAICGHRFILCSGTERIFSLQRDFVGSAMELHKVSYVIPDNDVFKPEIHCMHMYIERMKLPNAEHISGEHVDLKQ